MTISGLERSPVPAGRGTKHMQYVIVGMSDMLKQISESIQKPTQSLAHHDDRMST